MVDLNVMLRDQARNGLQAQLEKAVTDGDTAAATRIATDMAALAVSTAPKTTAYGADDIKAQLDKLPWFGVDPKKSARTMEMGKHMDFAKFPTATAFAEALVKAVELEFKPAAGEPEEPGDEEPADEGGQGGDVLGERRGAGPKPRKTDAPGEGDNNQRGTQRRSSGPWLKMADAPADVQADITRQMSKMLSSTATKEQREGFQKRALESHYGAHQRNKGKK